MKNSNQSPVVTAAFVKYSEEQIRAHPDLSELDKTLLWKIHRLDNPDTGYDGCHASNNALADYVGSVADAVKSRVKRLRKRGYLVTLGYSEAGIPRQRVRAKYGLKPGVEGSRIVTTEDGKPLTRNRKAWEVNPALYLLPDSSNPVGHPADPRVGHQGDPPVGHPADPLTRIILESEKKNPPTPFGKGGTDSFSSRTGEASVCAGAEPAAPYTDTPGASCGATTTPSVDRRPNAVVRVTNGNVGALFNTLPVDVTAALRTSFRPDQICPRGMGGLVRKWNQGLRTDQRSAEEITHLALVHVLANLLQLPTWEGSPVRYPKNLCDLVRRFPAIQHHFAGTIREPLADLECTRTRLAHPPELGRESQRLRTVLEQRRVASFDDYLDRGLEPGVRWLAGCCFHRQGDQSTRSNGIFDTDVVERCILQSTSNGGPGIDELVACIEEISGGKFVDVTGVSVADVKRLREHTEKVIETFAGMLAPATVSLDTALCARELDLSTLPRHVASAHVANPDYPFNPIDELTAAARRFLGRRSVPSTHAAEPASEGAPPAPLCPDPATVEPVSPAQCPGPQ